MKTDVVLPNDLDPMIGPVVGLLVANGVETFESCDGGDGHSFSEPTVRFHGGHGAGYHALSVAVDHALPVSQMRRAWDVDGWTITGPYWELIFFRESLRGETDV